MASFALSAETTNLEWFYILISKHHIRLNRTINTLKFSLDCNWQIDEMLAVKTWLTMLAVPITSPLWLDERLNDILRPWTDWHHHWVLSDISEETFLFEGCKDSFSGFKSVKDRKVYTWIRAIRKNHMTQFSIDVMMNSTLWNLNLPM